MSQTTEPQAPKGKLVSIKHRDLHAAAEVYEIFDALTEPERFRILGWINEKYSKPANVGQPQK